MGITHRDSSLINDSDHSLPTGSVNPSPTDAACALIEASSSSIPPLSSDEARNIASSSTSAFSGAAPVEPLIEPGESSSCAIVRSGDSR